MPVTKDDVIILCMRVGSMEPVQNTIIKNCEHCGSPVYVCPEAWAEATEQAPGVKPLCDVCLPDVLPDGYATEVAMPGPRTRAAFEKATGEPLTNELAITFTSQALGDARAEKDRRRGERN